MKVTTLFLVGLFCSFGYSKILVKDKFVFKVSGEVFSLNEIKQTFQQVRNLECIYPESLLIRVFHKEFQPEKKKFFVFKEQFETESKLYFEQIIPFFKLMVYSRSYEVKVNQAIEKYFALAAKQNKCDKSAIDQRKLSAAFREIVELEIFIRSRFLPAEKQGKADSGDLKKAVLAAQNLMASIQDQIEEEVYW